MSAAPRPRQAPMRERTRVRPTLRGASLAALALGLWLLGDAAALATSRALAAALLLALACAGLCLGICATGLHLRRQVLDAAVPVGDRIRVELELAAGSWFARLPLGRGAVRERLPSALGGTGDLALARRMSHTLPVLARGEHPLGFAEIHLRDPLGLLHLRRETHDGAVAIGLPRIEPLPATELAGRLGRAGDAPSSGPGSGELGPQARPHASGDDIRRIHWRATARTGRLMTCEEEPLHGRTAVIVLDARPCPDAPDQASSGSGAPSVPGARERAGADPEERASAHSAWDRAVEHAASLLVALAADGWRAEVVDADGARIAALEPGGVLDLASQIALATLRPTGPRSADAGALTVVIGVRAAGDEEDDAEHAARLRARALGSGRARGGAVALLLHAPAGAGQADEPVGSERTAEWTLVRASTRATLAQLLAAAAEAPR